MAEPTANMRHVSAALSNITVGWQQEMSAFVAQRVFPVVNVKHRTDTYYEFSRADQLRNERRRRAPGTESAGTGYKITAEEAFMCVQYSLHEDIPEADILDADDALEPKQDAVDDLLQKHMIGLEVDFCADFMKTNVWGMDVTGSSSPSGTSQILFWDDADSTPQADITRLKLVVQQDTAKIPNTLILSNKAFQVLRIHPSIVELYKYTQKDGGLLSAAMVAAALDLQNVLVSSAIYNSAAKGQSATTDFVMGNDALLCYVEPNPGKKKASAGYTFVWNAVGYDIPVKDFYIDALEAFRIEASIWYDQKQISSLLGVFIDGCISANYPTS